MVNNMDITEGDIKINNQPIIHCSDVNVFYEEKQALFDVDLVINEKEVTSLIGPSGC